MDKGALKKIIKPNTTKLLLPSSLLYIKLQRKHISALQFQLMLHKFHQVYTCKHICNFMFAIKHSTNALYFYLALISALETLALHITTPPHPPSCLELHITLCLMKSRTYSLNYIHLLVLLTHANHSVIFSGPHSAVVFSQIINSNKYIFMHIQVYLIISTSKHLQLFSSLLHTPSHAAEVSFDFLLRFQQSFHHCLKLSIIELHSNKCSNNNTLRNIY